jgi:hypothetical protein
MLNSWSDPEWVPFVAAMLVPAALSALFGDSWRTSFFLERPSLPAC